jgi:hypothetical protein
MGQGFAFEYIPNEVNHQLYLELYKKYRAIGLFTENTPNPLKGAEPL